MKSYKRAVPEGATTFEPALIVKAKDTDGPNQGGGQVFYSIKSVNTDATVFGIDSVTGEITIVQPVRSDQVENGLYSLVVSIENFSYALSFNIFQPKNTISHPRFFESEFFL